MGAKAGIEAQLLRFFREVLAFFVVGRIEPANNPAFPLNSCRANDDRLAGFIIIPRLLQSLAPFLLIVNIADEENRVKYVEFAQNVGNRPTSGVGVRPSGPVTGSGFIGREFRVLWLGWEWTDHVSGLPG